MNIIKNKTTALRSSLALATALAIGTPALAQYSLNGATPEASLSCDQLMGEIARMDQAMGLANTAIANAAGAAQATDTGVALGMEAALRSGALAKMPGLGRFAGMAAQAAKASAAAKAEQGAQAIQVAQQRRTMMAGLYQGRNCSAPTNMTAMTASMSASPASATAVAVAALAVTQDLPLRAAAAPTAAVIGNLRAGANVYPTGARNGVWMEVDDDNGARGWMSSAFAKPR
jgi:hypothetical protein